MFNRPGQSQGLLYKHKHYYIINLVSHRLPPMALRRCQAQEVWNFASDVGLGTDHVTGVGQ